jgi:hypothetical protein
MRWRRIACLSCLTVIIITVFIGVIFFEALNDFLAEEFSESNIVPERLSTSFAPQSDSGFIKDLSYIDVLAIGYSDDADPEYDGVAIDILFYDSKSESISFHDIPIAVDLELFGYRDPLVMFDSNYGEVIYEGSVRLDHSMRLGEMFGGYIRIPFDDIQANAEIYEPFGTLSLVVSTPEQGDFESRVDAVPIYPFPGQ